MEEKKSKWQAIVDGLEAKDYVRVLILAAFLIVGVVWVAFRGDNLRKDQKIEQIQAECVLMERNLNRYYQRREDSIIVDANQRIGKVQTDFYDFKDQIFDEMKQKQDRSASYVNSSKSLIRQYKKQVNETGKTTKQLDSISQENSD